VKREVIEANGVSHTVRYSGTRWSNIIQGANDAKSWLGAQYGYVKETLVPAILQADREGDKIHFLGIVMTMGMLGVRGWPVEALMHYWGVWNYLDHRPKAEVYAELNAKEGK
jgi:hypothetical protein